MYQRRTKPKDLSIFEQDYNGRWLPGPARYQRRSKRRRSAMPDYLPTFYWVLLMRLLEMLERPNQVVVNDLRPVPKNMFWHNVRVGAIALAAAPIIIWAAPVVLDFYFAR